MKPIYISIVFIIVILAQLGIPLKMIYDSEDTLMTGTVYKFKTQPIDPTDPFRGKYITLNFEMNSFDTLDSSYVYGDKIRVYIENDSNGFAVAKEISKEPLKINADYVMAKVVNNYNGKVVFELAFNRFYMKETKAYDAERAYLETNRDEIEDNVYALVYVKEGRSVLENVIIAGIPIQEYVE